MGKQIPINVMNMFCSVCRDKAHIYENCPIKYWRTDRVAFSGRITTHKTYIIIDIPISDKSNSTFALYRPKGAVEEWIRRKIFLELRKRKEHLPTTLDRGFLIKVRPVGKRSAFIYEILIKD